MRTRERLQVSGREHLLDHVAVTGVLVVHASRGHVPVPLGDHVAGVDFQGANRVRQGAVEHAELGGRPAPAHQSLDVVRFDGQHLVGQSVRVFIVAQLQLAGGHVVAHDHVHGVPVGAHGVHVPDKQHRPGRQVEPVERVREPALPVQLVARVLVPGRHRQLQLVVVAPARAGRLVNGRQTDSTGDATFAPVAHAKVPVLARPHFGHYRLQAPVHRAVRLAELKMSIEVWSPVIAELLEQAAVDVPRAERYP